jgi:transmembrane sensor
MIYNGISTMDIQATIVNYMNGSLTKEEAVFLRQWLHESPENRILFDNLRKVWLAADTIQDSSKDLDDHWNRFKKNLTTKEKSLPSHEVRKTIIPRILKLAASWIIFLALGSGITMLSIRKSGTSGTKNIEITTPLGSLGFIKLPDSTKVWLNAGTTLIYNEEYGRHTRTLELTGEAYFDVAKDRQHPFIVKTNELVIRALGTRFNVKAYPNERTTSATLEEGSIDVRIRRKGRSEANVILKPKEKVVLFKKTDASRVFSEGNDERIAEKKPHSEIFVTNDKRISVYTNVETELYTSWKDTRWIIQGETFGSLASMLERRFDVKIIFADTTLKQYRFSGIIENETVEQILDALKLTAPLDYSVNKNEIIFTLNTHTKEELQKLMEVENKPIVKQNK